MSSSCVDPVVALAGFSNHSIVTEPGDSQGGFGIVLLRQAGDVCDLQVLGSWVAANPGSTAVVLHQLDVLRSIMPEASHGLLVEAMRWV